ncbi:hypothetical protein LUZ60_002489 [Juncus effusus]|nr:hypothetical protein LUZ60_002489 [Juncus effusus]
MSGVTAIASLPGMTRQHFSHNDSQVSVGYKLTKCEWEDLFVIIGLVMVQLTNAAYMEEMAVSDKTHDDVEVHPSSFGRVRVTSFQALMMVGIKKTSPTIAAAMPNLAPGIIFIIAACLRFEKVDVKCIYTKAKIIGTLLCLGGAIALSFLQTPSTVLNAPKDLHNEWFVGCICLLGAVLVVSCNTVLQAATMIDFPAPFTLCSVTSILGAGFTAIFQGSVVSSICVAFNTWAVKKKGPVMVSMFSPTSTVGSVIFSAIYLHQIVKFGSVFGMIILFTGLYIVLWAKKRENIASFYTDEEASKRTDVEAPLLA